MELGENEPPAGPWRVESLARFTQLVLEAAGVPLGRPPIVAIDGRSSSGKTTLARHLEDGISGATTVHTDDIAWWSSFFGWSHMLVGDVLEPIHRGQSVRFRPPRWDERNRPGAIEVPIDSALVIVEGVGAGRREVAHLLDRTVWVQSDLCEIDRRNAARIASGEANGAIVDQWMAEEGPFLAEQRAWERAFIIVNGTPDLPYDPLTQVVIASPPHGIANECG